MQPTQPPPGDARLFAMPSSRKELHNVSICGPVYHATKENALQRSTVANSQPFAPVYSACSQGVSGGGTCSQAMQRGPV